MQSEVIKYQPSGGRCSHSGGRGADPEAGPDHEEQLDQSHKDVRLFGRMSTVMAFLLGVETVLLLVATGIIAL
mgnify:CR=1 FL=1